MFWNQFDFYLNPNGTTFGARKGNEPVHIMYNIYQKCVNVVNNTYTAYPGAEATLSIYDIEGNLISNPLKKTINIQADSASQAVEYSTSGINRKGPITVGLVKNKSGANEPFVINYYGKITDAYGVIDLWNNDEIQSSLVKPTSDVYFIRLELKEATGKILSLNSYAVPMRNDVARASHAWNRSGTFQVGDLTQLNHLPEVDLKLTQGAKRSVGNKTVLTYRINNPTKTIAYAVEVKAYTGKDRKRLVAPVFYDDNLFTLFPDESRDLEISYNRSDLKSDAFVTVNCYNNVIKGKEVARNIYADIQTGGSNNIARGKTVTGGTNPMNITTVTENGLLYAKNGQTFIDSDINTFASLTPEEGSFVVDLETVQNFDRIMLRWNRQNFLRGRPDHIRVEISDNNTDYTVVANHDNSSSGSIMTNIVLPTQAKGRYVKITPTGLCKESPAVGMTGRLSSGGVSGQSVSGIDKADAATSFNLSAIEIYTF